MKRLELIGVCIACFVALLLIALRLTYACLMAPDRAWHIALAIDDCSNVAANGSLGQTISVRAARARNGGQRWGCILCKFLDKLDPGHCDNALTDEEQNLK